MAENREEIVRIFQASSVWTQMSSSAELRPATVLDLTAAICSSKQHAAAMLPVHPACLPPGHTPCVQFWRFANRRLDADINEIGQ